MAKFIYSDNTDEFATKIISWLKKKQPHTFLLLYSGLNSKAPPPNNKKLLLGVSFNKPASINQLESITPNNGDIPLLGYLSYELKNQFEKLKSTGSKISNGEQISFFKPDYYLEINSNNEIRTTSEKTFLEINAPTNHLIISKNDKNNCEVEFNKDVSDEDYLSNIELIKENIKNGSVYELNYCRKFEAKVSIDPYSVFALQMSNNQSPYSFLFKNDIEFVISGSMERFLCKKGNKLISQPIKGTLKNKNQNIAKEQKQLLNDAKERAENLMIVDLVRNDLSKCSITGSVKVQELFGIYSYPSVHQMISSVSSRVKAETSFSEIIQSLFPMGSMTGAPKISAMKTIDDLETFQRGLFSGAFGYIMPNGDFDLNVVIRSIFYNSKSHLINIPVGSAITIDSNGEQELNECNHKIDYLKKLISNCRLDSN
ncbi:MAG: anthranilate synthase component I family protein [Bacteroidia bacterium]